MRADLEHMLAVQRRYNMRQLLRRQLCAIEILPACKYDFQLALHCFIISLTRESSGISAHRPWGPSLDLLNWLSAQRW